MSLWLDGSVTNSLLTLDIHTGDSIFTSYMRELDAIITQFYVGDLIRLSLVYVSLINGQ